MILAALEGFETALDRHLGATGIRLKSEKTRGDRGALVPVVPGREGNPDGRRPHLDRIC